MIDINKLRSVGSEMLLTMTLYAGWAAVATSEASAALIWSSNTGGAIDSSPAVVDGVVYVGSDSGSVYAFNASTGQLLWQTLTGGAVDSSATVVDGHVFIGSDSDLVYALDAATGAFEWDFATLGDVDSSPSVINGVVYVGSDDGFLYAIEAIPLVAVSEPASLALLAFGLAGMGFSRRRTR